MADLFSSVLGGAVGGTAVGAAIVRLSLDSKQYQAQLAGAKGQTTAGLNAMGASASKFGTAMKVGLLVGGVALVGFAASAVKAFTDAQVVMAQTEAVIKSTGMAAGVTAEQVGELAARWQDLTGIEDEAVQSAENILLTFPLIRNELGANNDIFNQATAAALDLATAIGGGVIPSAEALMGKAQQLGKALSDPVLGMMALRRSGVAFTAEQRDMVKALVESGDLLGAQKIILAEVAVQYGNAAEAAGQTFAGKIARLSAEFDDFKESVGAVLVPALSTFVDVLTAIPQPVLAAVTIIGTLTVAIGGLTVAASMANKALAGTFLAGVLRFIPPVALATVAVGLFAKGIRDSDAPVTIATERVQKYGGALTVSLGPALSGTTLASDEARRATYALAAAHIFDTQKARENARAETDLAGTLLGLAEQAEEVKKLQAELNRLREKGRGDTAKAQALEAQLLGTYVAFKGALKDYAAGLDKQNLETDDAIAKLIHFGKQLGLNKQDVIDILGPLGRYGGLLEGLPTEIRTKVYLQYIQQGATPSELGGGLGPHHSGGPVGGPAGGNVPAMLQQGEYVINRAAAARIGSANLAALNQMHGGGQAGAVAAQGRGAGVVNIYQYFTGDNFSADLPDMIEEGARRALVMLGRP